MFERDIQKAQYEQIAKITPFSFDFVVTTLGSCFNEIERKAFEDLETALAYYKKQEKIHRAAFVHLKAELQIK